MPDTLSLGGRDENQSSPSVGIVIGMLVGGGGTYLLTSQLGAAPAKEAAIKQVGLKLLDFGYNTEAGGPELRVKAGEVVTITLTNKGKWSHEFRIVTDKDGYISNMQKVVSDLRPRGIEEQSIVEAAPEYNQALTFPTLKVITTDGEPDYAIKLRPGETKTIKFAVDKPGTYWYLCGIIDGTIPLTHAHRGMLGQIVVIP